jgi:hypothetical protein
MNFGELTIAQILLAAFSGCGLIILPWVPRLRPSSVTSQNEGALGDKGLRQLAIDV